MAAMPTVVASTDGVHADLHEHLERIYTSITTTEERVWIEPFKNIFQDITTALLECDLSDTKSRIRTNKIINRNVLLFEGMPLRSRHDEGSINPDDYSSLESAMFVVTDWCKALPLDVWFQWVLQYTSEQLILHSTRIAQTFPGMSDVLDALDDGVDALNTNIFDSQSEFQLEDFLVATTETIYGCVVRCYGARLHRDIISDEFHGVHALLCKSACSSILFKEQHDKMGTFIRRTKNHTILVMLKIRFNLTRSTIRRWIPLILTAVHLHSPITEWVNCENSMHHHPPTPSSTCPQHCGSNICFQHGWLPFAFTLPMKVLFVEITALVVMKEQMRHIVVPMAERAISGQVTTPSVGDEAIPEAVDDLQSNIFNNTDAPALSFQFLVDFDAYVLTKLRSFVTLLTKRAKASVLYLELQLKSVIMVHLAVAPADAVAVPTPSIVHENSTIGDVASIEESSLSGDAASQDSVDGSGVTPSVHSLLHHLLHEASHGRLRRFLCGGAAHPDLVDQIKTQPPSKMSSIIAAQVQDEGSDTDRSELVELLRIARGLCVSHTTTFEYWHLLSIGEQPQNLGSVGIHCICDIISATTETLLMDVYSSTVREASTQQQHQHQQQSTDTHQDASLPQHTRLPSEVQHEAVIALIETAIHCTWRMEALGDLDELNTMMTTTMRKLLAQLPPEATREYHCIILEAIHNYLLTAQSNIHNAPATQTGVVDATRSIITLMNHVELRAALKLTLFINEEHPFFRHMDAALRVRLLSRPPPSSKCDDNAFEKQRHQLETDVLNYLRNYHGCKEQVQRMLNVCDTFHSSHFISHTSPATPIANVTDMRPASQPSHVPLPPTSLVVHVLGMCHWGYHPSTYLVIQQTSSTTTSTIVAYTNTSSTVPKDRSSDAEELPFPADLAAALVDYSHEYQQQKHHEQRQLHWCRDYAYTTFVIYYPQDGGLPTTIHGTLLLQRLFVALAGYKRVGVTWSHLAARAHMSVEELKEQLHKCVELGLLVCVGKNDEGEEGHGVEYVAMNYDYVRPVESTDGVIVLWPEPLRHVRDMVAARRTITDAQRVEQLAPVVMSIMKERKRITYSELFDLVRAAAEPFFVATWAMFKACVEGLIDRHYLSRIVQNGGLPVLNASIMLEYVP